jgi:surfeit locus 1 family protein
MAYRFRRPELLPTVVMAFTIALMFGLGIWQLKRLEWKNALMANIEAAQTEAPKDLLSYDPADLQNAEWHNIYVSGRLLNEKELHATPRYLKEKMGYAVLTPLAVTSKGKTFYVLINRGWVAPEQKDAATRKAGNPDGVVRIEGVIRNPMPQGRFRPDNRPDKNMWFWYDIAGMAKETGLQLMPVMIDATRITLANGSAVESGPEPFPLEINIRNDHLGYAITWFLIGLSGLVMYVLYYTEKR